jgi:hypothetical protein
MFSRLKIKLRAKAMFAILALLVFCAAYAAPSAFGQSCDRIQAPYGCGYTVEGYDCLWRSCQAGGSACCYKEYGTGNCGYVMSQICGGLCCPVLLD